MQTINEISTLIFVTDHPVETFLSRMLSLAPGSVYSIQPCHIWQVWIDALRGISANIVETLGEPNENKAEKSISYMRAPLLYQITIVQIFHIFILFHI